MELQKITRAYRQYFTKALVKHFPQQAAGLISDIDNHFLHLYDDVRFAATSTNPMDRRLNFSAYFLALIQTLEANGQTYEEIKNICLEITYDYVSPKSGFQKWLKQLPPKLMGTKLSNWLVNIFSKKVNMLAHEGGFKVQVITGKAETNGLGYGVDIIECGICKLFAKHGAGMYVKILCEVDKLTSGLAGLELVRTSTIGYGGEKCDFRWKRLKR